MRSALPGRVYRMFGSRPFIFFSIIMVFKSYVAWLAIFDDMPFWAPLVSEIPFIWAIFCLIEWFSSKRKMTAYLIVNLALTAIFFSVIIYYKYYGVIATWRALEQVNQVTAVKNSVFSLIHPQFLFIFSDIVVFIYLLIDGRRKKHGPVYRLLRICNRPNERRGIMTLIFALSVIGCIMNIWPHRTSMNEVVQAAEMGILNYEAYALIANDEYELIDKSEITQDAIDELKGVRRVFPSPYQGWAAGRNLILIQMESLQNFLIGLEVEGQEVTPNLNALAREGLYFPDFYHMVGQGNTSDAEFVVNTSFYIPPQGAATMRYVDRELPSLPRLLGARGYETMTFHTNTAEFWNRTELYAALGWDRYYDDRFFGTEDSVFFGASDDVLYRKTAEELARVAAEGNKFYAQVISMTAHHPFTLPKEKIDLRLSARYDGTFVGDYLEAQHYADAALGRFVEDLKARGIWQNSLVVIYGDHVGLPIYSLNRREQQLLAELIGHEYGYADMINVPLLILAEGRLPAERFDGRLGGQVDVLPTVAALMGIPLNGHVHFGQNLLIDQDNLIPQRYYLPSGTVVNGRSLFIPGESWEDGTLYPLSGVPGDETVVTKDAFERALRLLQLSDSYVRQLPERSPDDRPVAVVPEPEEAEAPDADAPDASDGAGASGAADRDASVADDAYVADDASAPDAASAAGIGHAPDAASAAGAGDASAGADEAADANEAAEADAAPDAGAATAPDAVPS
ncbi:LTA synthase family protein [Thermobacillus sp. ZCTH02-B1]|uniref:LTA synthase family protein n=1 Tax=Thermobacillus sp. ZCTH02-B1 TaxID=1858795 RepID=UPI0026AE2087